MVFVTRAVGAYTALLRPADFSDLPARAARGEVLSDKVR